MLPDHLLYFYRALYLIREFESTTADDRFGGQAQFLSAVIVRRGASRSLHQDLTFTGSQVSKHD
jgi:hypothetical protein